MVAAWWPRPPSPPQPSDSSLYESTPDVVVPPLDMSTLASRMRAIQESESVQQRLEALPCAWVLVFDADTEEEAVYSMEMDSEQHVVLAFEDREEAEQYALSLRDSFRYAAQHRAGRTNRTGPCVARSRSRAEPCSPPARCRQARLQLDRAVGNLEDHLSRHPRTAALVAEARGQGLLPAPLLPATTTTAAAAAAAPGVRQGVVRQGLLPSCT